MSWRRQWHPTPVLLPGKSHWRRSYLIMDLTGISLRAVIWASVHVLFAIHVSPWWSVCSTTLNFFLLGLKTCVLTWLPWVLASARGMSRGHGLSLAVACRLRSWAARAWVLRSMWSLSSLTRDQTLSPALHTGLLTTGPWGKSHGFFNCWFLRALYIFSVHIVGFDLQIFSHSIACLYILLKCFSERKI